MAFFRRIVDFFLLQTINVDNLIKICSKKLSLFPAHKKALYIRASAYLKKGSFPLALADSNKLLSLDPSNVDAYYIRGCAYEKLNEIDKGKNSNLKKNNSLLK